MKLPGTFFIPGSFCLMLLCCSTCNMRPVKLEKFNLAEALLGAWIETPIPHLPPESPLVAPFIGSVD